MTREPSIWGSLSGQWSSAAQAQMSCSGLVLPAAQAPGGANLEGCGEGARLEASWRLLLSLGLIGGGPTFLGTLVGHQFTSDATSVVFLTLAAGSILYVVVQLLAVAQKAGRRELLAWGLFLGLAAGFVTDMIVSAAGA